MAKDNNNKKAKKKDTSKQSQDMQNCKVQDNCNKQSDTRPQQ